MMEICCQFSLYLTMKNVDIFLKKGNNKPHTMSRKDNEQLIKDFCSAILKHSLDSPDKMRKAAKATELTYVTVEQAKIYGKGSVTTFGLLFCHVLKIKPENLQNYNRKFYKFLESSKSLSKIDSLIADIRKKQSVDEIVSWLRLLLAKNEIDEKSSDSGRKKK